MVDINKAEAEQIRLITRAAVVRMGHGDHYVMSEEPEALQQLALMRGYKDTNKGGKYISAREQMMNELK